MLTKNLLLASSVFVLANLALAPQLQAAQTYQCQITLTHSDCTFFCESEAESRAQDCAVYRCESASGEHCEVLNSRSWSWVSNYSAVKYFVGNAIARPSR